MWLLNFLLSLVELKRNIIRSNRDKLLGISIYNTTSMDSRILELSYSASTFSKQCAKVVAYIVRRIANLAMLENGLAYIIEQIRKRLVEYV